MTDTLRDRIAAAIDEERNRWAGGDAPAETLADAVIAELRQEWRADFGYDGYANYATREEAAQHVADFNEALGDDIRDGEQAVVMYRHVTEWETDA